MLPASLLCLRPLSPFHNQKSHSHIPVVPSDCSRNMAWAVCFLFATHPHCLSFPLQSVSLIFLLSKPCSLSLSNSYLKLPSSKEPSYTKVHLTALSIWVYLFPSFTAHVSPCGTSSLDFSGGGRTNKSRHWAT